MRRAVYRAAHGVPHGQKRRNDIPADAYPGAAVRTYLRLAVRSCVRSARPPALVAPDPDAADGYPAVDDGGAVQNLGAGGVSAALLVLDEQWQGTLCAAQCDLLRAAENLLDNAVRYTPRGGTVTLLVTKEKQDFILRVTDTGPGFTPEALAKAGEMLYTDAARSDAAHQGLGLYFARKVAQSHGGVLVLSNLPAAHGACAELRLPICE